MSDGIRKIISTAIIAGSYIVGGPFLAIPVSIGLGYMNSLYLRPTSTGLHKRSVSTGKAGIPVVYGTRLVTNIPVFYGGDNTWLWLCLVWCEGPVHEVGTEYLNGVIQTDDRYNVDGTDDFTAIHREGTDTQSAVTTIGDQSAPAEWDSSRRLLGVAYTMALLLYVEEVWGAGGIPSITSHITGITVTDWRTGADLPDYSVSLHNPIVCLYDYLTNARYGVGIDPARIDTTSFTAAANYCDDAVVIDGESFTERYTCDVVLMPDDGPMTNIQQILNTCRGVLYKSGPVWKVRIDKPETPSFTFDGDNIVGGLTIYRLGKEHVYNRLNVSYTDSDGDYSQQIVTLDSPELRAQDNDVLITGEVSADGVTSAARAKMLGVIAINETRQDIMCSLIASRESIINEIGDVVYIKHPTPGWDVLNSGAGKEFRITEIEMQRDGNLKFTFREYSSDIYDWSDIQVLDTAPNTGLPDVGIVPTPGGLTVSESKFSTRGGGGVKARVTVAWLDPEDSFIAGYEVFYRESSESTYTQLGSTVDLSFSVDDFKPGDYYFKVRARNNYGFLGAFSAAKSATIIGLYDIPSDISGFSVVVDSTSLLVAAVWDAVDDLDVKIGGYVRIRYSPATSGATWDTSTDVVPRVPGIQTNTVFPGAIGTYFAKAYDSVGQESGTAASYVVTSFPAGSGTAINTDTWTDPWDVGNVLTGVVENGSGEYELNTGEVAGTVEILPSMYLDTNADGTGSAQWAVIKQEATFAVSGVDDSSTLFDSRTGNVDDWMDWDGTASGGGTADYFIEYKVSTNNGATYSSSWVRLASPNTSVYATDIKIRLNLTRTTVQANIAVTDLTLAATTP